MTAAGRALHTTSVLGVALTALLFPFPVILVQLADDPLFYYRVVILVADVPLAAAAIAAVLELVIRHRRPTPPIVVGAALVAALGLALLVHPSAQGAQTVVRLAAVVALAAAVTTFRADERAVAVAAFGVSAIGQTALALAQLGHGGPLGYTALGEFADPLLGVGDALAPRGTMYHPYVLAGFALVAATVLCAQGLRAARPWPWLAAASLAIVPVGLSYSRGAAFGLLAVCAALAIGLRGRLGAHVLAIALLLAGAGIPALATLDAWTARAETTFTGRPIREILAGQGLALLASAPVTGIGPGRSVIALRAKETAKAGSIVLAQPVHDVPLLAAVEGGPLAGTLATALLGCLAWRVRARPSALAVLVGFLPFVLLDHYPYTHAQGLVMFGIWLGSLAGQVIDE